MKQTERYENSRNVIIERGITVHAQYSIEVNANQIF